MHESGGFRHGHATCFAVRFQDQADVFGEACGLEHDSRFRLYRLILQALADTRFVERVSHALQNRPEIENLQAMACMSQKKNGPRMRPVCFGASSADLLVDSDHLARAVMIASATFFGASE